MIYTTKKELAQAYCPDIDYTAALKKLNHWIRTNTELSARLAATGYITTQRRFTPQQVKLLYHYLGEPFQLSEEVPQKSIFTFLHFYIFTEKWIFTPNQRFLKSINRIIIYYIIIYYNIIYNNYNIHFIFPSLSRITFKKVFLCKNVKM